MRGDQIHRVAEIHAAHDVDDAHAAEVQLLVHGDFELVFERVQRHQHVPVAFASRAHEFTAREEQAGAEWLGQVQNDRCKLALIVLGSKAFGQQPNGQFDCEGGSSHDVLRTGVGRRSHLLSEIAERHDLRENVECGKLSTLSRNG